MDLPPRGEIAATEIAVWGAFLLFLLVRAIRPEITWGEKPMDFSFLNALYRTPTLPPPEPWLSGSLLSYTYFGQFLVAAIGKTLAIHPGVMFNIGIAAFAGLFAAALFAAGAALGRLASVAGAPPTESTRVGLLAVFLTLVCGNLAGLREALARKTLNFDYFWATSRAIKDTINEYPFWSFLFADLHAHVLAMPFTVSFVALLLMWVTRPEPFERVPFRARAALLALLALTLGTVMVTNGWSTPTYVALSLFVLGLAFLWHREPGKLRLALGLLGRVLVPAALVVLGGLLFYRPFWKHFTPPERNWGIEKGPYARPWDYLNIFGLFLLLVVPFLFLLFRRSMEAGPAERRRAPFTAALLALLVVTLLDLPAFAKGAPGQAPSVRGFALALTALGLWLALDRSVPERFRMPVALATFALGVTGGCELIYVWDRMNTVFKFYIEAWSLLGLASAVVLYELFWGSLVPAGRLRTLWRAAAGVGIAAALFTSLTGIVGVLTMKRVPGPSLTLDGTAYLARFAPYDRSAYEWLNKNVPGIPVLCEAWGPSYQEYSRVSMNTGLPIVIGWDYHVFQRGHSHAEIDKRKADVELIYTSDDEKAVAAALRRYHVALVYVGQLERGVYAGGNLASFRKWTDLMAPVYENPGVAIFAVNGAFAAGAPVETVEMVAEEKGAAPEKEKKQDAAGRLSQPRGVASDKDGNIYVCDFGNNRIQKLGPKLEPLVAWGKRGKGVGEFQDPCGIAVSPAGEVFVADTWNGRVQVFTSDGKYVREWGGDFFGPRGIALGAEGEIYLSDTGNHRIVRFGKDGKREAVIGAKGAEPGKLNEPVGVAVDLAGRVLVCDNDNGRLQTFDRDGRFLSSFPVPGWRAEVYSEPGVAVDDAGRIWVTVPREHEVRAYAADGTLAKTVKKQDLPAGARFEMPVGIAWVPAEKKLIVSDIENRLVWV
ncbi:MAG TPA: DUF2298 domain-containing protein, partial [Thermoanaerobaculia bacterium]|nr:DUF2298 domain-containing protein [Thermoanaerobaculia bacterium]